MQLCGIKGPTAQVRFVYQQCSKSALSLYFPLLFINKCLLAKMHTHTTSYGLSAGYYLISQLSIVPLTIPPGFINKKLPQTSAN